NFTTADTIRNCLGPLPSAQVNSRVGGPILVHTVTKWYATRLCTKSPWFLISLCSLCVLCVSVVDEFQVKPHHRDTENTEVAQRRARSRLFVQSQALYQIRVNLC